MTFTLDIRPSETLIGKRILIIEDEIFVALDLKMELEAAGATLLGPAASLNAALDAADDPSLDAAIVDVDLKGKHSYAVADVLKKHNTPFIWHTGVIDRDIFGSSFPDVPVIEKPTREGAIIEALTQLLAPSEKSNLDRL
ncbi:response regulator [Loktanella sp. F6476L]|uniref:response regulator n=1 Tax=Loktanella sp. F6476L TaxID=2926405 RepID=UPI001FF21ECC|nr:response regulator [Loktanella sp. F6476L]MCK0121509.1 response regulator [Loktanella sp. F6476L]